MKTLGGNPSRDAPDSFRVDTEDVAALARLRGAHAVEAGTSEELEVSLRRLWDDLQGAPDLARLAWLAAERTSPPVPRVVLNLVRSDDPPCTCHRDRSSVSEGVDP